MRKVIIGVAAAFVATSITVGAVVYGAMSSRSESDANDVVDMSPAGDSQPREQAASQRPPTATPTTSFTLPDHSLTTRPTEPPARICGNRAVLDGPTTPPAGAVVVPPGDNASFDFSGPGRTFWFAPGAHMIGDGNYDQIVPADQQTYIGAPGAILDGRNRNLYAFTQDAVGVTITHLTI